MPRSARVDPPGALYHATARGIERRVILRYRSASCSTVRNPLAV